MLDRLIFVVKGKASIISLEIFEENWRLVDQQGMNE